MSIGPNWLVILPIIGSWGYDFSAFFTGSLLGKTKLAPSISPKKTVEGMIGGLIGCSVSNVLIARFAGIDSRFYLFLFIMGLVLGTMSQLGDLCESAIKRGAGAKDSAKVIPGHGGLLDKCDGLLFVLPTSYYITYFAYLIYLNLTT
jgi:phosphatidate cytidylyltransferase